MTTYTMKVEGTDTAWVDMPKEQIEAYISKFGMIKEIGSDEVLEGTYFTLFGSEIVITSNKKIETKFKAVFLTDGAYNKKGFAQLVFGSMADMYEAANTNGWYLDKYEVIENGETIYVMQD